MTGLKDLPLSVEVSIHGGHFALNLPTYQTARPNAAQITVMLSGDQTLLDVACRWQTLHGKICLLFAINELRLPQLQQVLLIVDGSPLDITPIFDRYRLDANKLGDNVYLTRTVFNAGTRALSGDDLFVISHAYLNSVALDNPNFGGFITLLAYRIADDLATRAELLENVYQTYRQYAATVVCHDAVAFRWLVSCSSALTTTLLAADRIHQAEDVADTALRLIVHPSLNPMVHQNYTLLLFQAGLVKASRGLFDEATYLFIAAVNASRYGLIDLLHPQNNWMLGQLSDCFKFLHVAEAAYLAAVACSRNKLPPQARFAPLTNPPELRINFQQLFERFACFKSSVPDFFSQVLTKMLARQQG